MRIALAILLALIGLAAPSIAQPAATEQGRTAFRAIDIYLDPQGAPLAAYQLEFAATNGAVKIVGIEGGESPAFREPPFYDPKAMQQDRVIIAAFSTNAVAGLPSSRTRVATIHISSTGVMTPGFELKLQTAAEVSGQRIQPVAAYEERKTE